LQEAVSKGGEQGERGQGGGAEAFGFREARQQGSHHIFVRPDVKELVNLQDVHGMAKPCQVRQFLKLVERYNLRLGGRP